MGLRGFLRIFDILHKELSCGFSDSSSCRHLVLLCVYISVLMRRVRVFMCVKWILFLDLCHFLRDLLRSAIRSKTGCGSWLWLRVFVVVVVCFFCALVTAVVEFCIVVSRSVIVSIL